MYDYGLDVGGTRAAAAIRHETLATADAGGASSAARSYVPAAPSQASAGTLMCARRMRASSAVQPQHARRAVRCRWNAAMPSSDAGAARAACRRSGRTRCGEGSSSVLCAQRRPPCWHMPHMKRAGGGGASQMWWWHGGIPAAKGVAWTRVRPHAVRVRRILLF